MNKTLLATTALAFVAASASAVDVELYGQVDKGVFAFDDGTNTDFAVLDNDYSGTRFGFKGAQALDNGLTASVLFEAESQPNPSDTFTQSAAAVNSNAPSQTPAGSAASAAGSFAERQARVGLSGNFGGVYVGHQATALDGVYDNDLTGASDVMSADFGSIGGGIKFRNSNALSTYSGATVGGLTQSFASNERADSVRYDSPIVAGFQGRASVAQGGDTEASVVYAGGMKDLKVSAALGVNEHDGSTGTATIADRTERTWAGSVSVAHSSGLAGTLAYTKQDIANKTSAEDEPDAWYGKVSYSWDAFEVAADYGKSENYGSLTTKNELKGTGLAAQYNLGNGVSLAALYRNFDADLVADTDAVNLYGVNMRVKF